MVASDKAKPGDLPQDSEEEERGAGGIQTHVDMEQDVPDPPPQDPVIPAATTTHQNQPSTSAAPHQTPGQQQPPKDNPAEKGQKAPTEQEVLHQMVLQ